MVQTFYTFHAHRTRLIYAARGARLGAAPKQHHADAEAPRIVHAQGLGSRKTNPDGSGWPYCLGASLHGVLPRSSTFPILGADFLPSMMNALKLAFSEAQCIEKHGVGDGVEIGEM
jgi:hypothetical protein